MEEKKQKMNNIQRIVVLIIVIVASMSAYPLLAITTALNINPRDPLYFETQYTSQYNVSIDNEFSNAGTFQSDVIDEDTSNATLSISGMDTKWSLVTPQGKWINGTTRQVSEFSLIYWIFIENPVQETLKGVTRAHSDKEVYLIDPWGIIGPENATYTLKFIKFYIETFRDISNQVSNLYDVFTNDTGVKLGQALYDTTCGMLWKFDIFNLETSKNSNVTFVSTDFLISRNRYTTMYCMLCAFVVGFLIFIIIAKWKQYSKQQIGEMAIFIAIGFFAFFIDGIIDIWFTANIKSALVIHGVYILALLVVSWKGKHQRVVFIPILELLMCGVMLFFHGTIDLVLTFGPANIAGWIALMADVRARMSPDKILPLKFTKQ